MSRRGRGQKVRGGATYECKEIMTKELPMAEVEDVMVFTYMHDVREMVTLRWKA